MIYVVSGFPRSGTSTAMRALEAGGLSVVSDPRRSEKLMRSCDGEGFLFSHGKDVYESTARERRVATWPRRHDGKGVKVLTFWLTDLAVHEYKVLFLTRDSEEIRQSAEAAFGAKLSCRNIETQVAEGLATLRNRRDVVELMVLPCDDLFSSPGEHLAKLGWPIDVERAASVVGPLDTKRFNLEQLTVGA